MGQRLTRPPVLRVHTDDAAEIYIDLFAGGGGASTAIEWALDRSPDVAVNHDPEAVAMHAANHPTTRHLCGNVWDYAPLDVTQGRPVGVLWASPTCVDFSRAKGGALDRKKATRIRSLAWVVTRYARDVTPRVIFVENVEAFADWSPLLADGKRCTRRKGQTFRAWVRKLESLGYVVEWRELRACDYGAPTSRRRLFVVARCDGQAIVWPEPTHGKHRLPYETAAACIDWGLPSVSIFDRKKPLAEATLRRIARGIQKFIFDAAKPFIIPVSHSGDARVHDVDDPLRTITASSRSPFALVAPTLIQTSYGERKGQAPRTLDLHQPLGTVVAGGQKHALVCAFMAKHFGGHGTPGAPLQLPLSTITTQDHHALVTVALGGDSNERPRCSADHDRGGCAGGASGRNGLEAAQPEHDTAASSSSAQGEVEAGVRAGDRVDRRDAIHRVRASTRVDRPARSDRPRASGESQGRGQDEQSPGQPRGGHALGERPARLRHWPACPHGSCRGPLEAGRCASRGGALLCTDRVGSRCVSGDGIQSGAARIRSFLTTYNGTSIGQPLQLPLGTVTTRDRFGLVMVRGEAYEITDITMRMLVPRELATAQGFARDYVLTPLVNGKPLSQTAQVRMIGNSVSPYPAAAIVRANVPRKEAVAA